MTRTETLQQMKQTLEQKVTEVGSNSKEFQGFLLFYTKNFPQYSFRNRMLIYAQNKTATHVAGFHKWSSLGYRIKKGAKALVIYAPIKRKEEEEVKFFFPVRVFDDTQVEATEKAVPLPHLDTSLQKDSKTTYPISLLYTNTKEVIEKKLGKKIRYYTPTGAENGKTDGKEIWLKKREEVAMLGTLVHEYVHCLFHFEKDKTTRNQKEVEAELGAMIFGSLFHLDIKKKYLYLHCYQEGVSLLEAFERVLPTIENLVREVEENIANTKRGRV